MNTNTNKEILEAKLVERIAFKDMLDKQDIARQKRYIADTFQVNREIENLQANIAAITAPVEEIVA